MQGNITYIGTARRPRTKHPNYSGMILQACLLAIITTIVVVPIMMLICDAAASANVKTNNRTKTENMVYNVVQKVEESTDIKYVPNQDTLGQGSYTVEEIGAPDTYDPYISLDVPMDYESNTGFKAYMDYRTITSPSSKQYAMQQEAYTDPETGIRMYDGCYMVALGTFYAQQAGERFHITLTSGIEFDAITGDIKADIHTDEMHQHRNGNIVEFVVDTKTISKTCKVMGDMSYAGFEGQVEKIEKLVEFE